MLNKADIIALVSDLKLPDNEYWISAGAGLVLHGVKELTRDIDVGCTTNLLDSMLQKGCPLLFTPDGMRKTICGETLEFFENWFADEVENIDGICVASLLSIKKHKVALGREKDSQDIVLIDAFIASRTK